MKLYVEMQTKYDEELHAGREAQPENVKLSHDMADILTKIESHRAQWMGMKDNMKKMKERLGKIDDEVTVEKAELVSTAGLLDQNDKLRSQIQAEERERARAQIQEEITTAKLEMEAQTGNALEEKSEQITKLEKDIENKLYEIQQFKMTLNEKDIAIQGLEKYSNSLEEKLTDAEVLLEAVKTENDELKKDQNIGVSSTEIEELKGKLELFESEKYNMFEVLMNQFQDERKELLSRHKATQDLLASATKDIIHLAAENEQLKFSLRDALTWESK